jgi:hypothetical protein
MIVSSQLLKDYLECSTKCWLRSRAEPATGNFYAEWARPQNETWTNPLRGSRVRRRLEGLTRLR